MITKPCNGQNLDIPDVIVIESLAHYINVYGRILLHKAIKLTGTKQILLVHRWYQSFYKWLADLPHDDWAIPVYKDTPL